MSFPKDKNVVKEYNKMNKYKDGNGGWENVAL